MKYSLDELYKIAKEHKDNHKSCGGEPYKSFFELERIVNSLGGNLKILEVGTAVGFTTFILHNPLPGREGNYVDTIEFHQDHADDARKNISDWGGDIEKINFLVGDAKDILCMTPGGHTYDVIFFDGYGAKLVFYNDFERLLKIGGILITANQHLKSTEPEYFKELEESGKWEFIEEFEDTKVYRKLL